MKKTALITGIVGQDGPYLAQLLLKKDYHVIGTILPKIKPDFANTDYLSVTDKIDFIENDVTDEKSVEQLIKKVKPTEVYNFAALSFPGSSWDRARITTEVNSLGVLNLLIAIKKFSPSSKFFQASSAAMFGSNKTNGCQSEATPFRPENPYAISKLYAHWMTVNYRESYNIFACNGILFNHESPLRGPDFVTRKISQGVARIKMGLEKNIRLGNLDAKRDWGYAKDYVEAMWLMLNQPKPDDYIVATGECHSIKDFLITAFACIGEKDWEKYVVIDQQFIRPKDADISLGQPAKAKKQLGWQPKVGFEELVKMMVEADLQRLSEQAKNSL